MGTAKLTENMNIQNAIATMHWNKGKWHALM